MEHNHKAWQGIYTSQQTHLRIRYFVHAFKVVFYFSQCAIFTRACQHKDRQTCKRWTSKATTLGHSDHENCHLSLSLASLHSHTYHNRQTDMHESCRSMFHECSKTMVMQKCHIYQEICIFYQNSALIYVASIKISYPFNYT